MQITTDIEYRMTRYENRWWKIYVTAPQKMLAIIIHHFIRVLSLSNAGQLFSFHHKQLVLVNNKLIDNSMVLTYIVNETDRYPLLSYVGN